MRQTLQAAQENRPGGTAGSPTHVPPAGWLDIVKRGWRQGKEHNASLLVKQRGLALLLTLGGIVFFALTIGLVAVIPALLNHFELGVAGTVLIQVARWGLLVGVVLVALAVLYRVGPDRADPRLRWASVGAVVATALWVADSIAFSFYVSTFGNYNKTYGALAGVVILLLWLYLTCFSVLLGAEINAATELQTAADTTTGDPLPKAGDGLGRLPRGAAGYPRARRRARSGGGAVSMTAPRVSGGAGSSAEGHQTRRPNISLRPPLPAART